MHVRHFYGITFLFNENHTNNICIQQDTMNTQVLGKLAPSLTDVGFKLIELR